MDPKLSCDVAATAAACIFLLTKQQLASRSTNGTCCITSLRTSSGKSVRQTMMGGNLK